ncbi:RNB domain-containing ribonuclease [Leucobacter aridicollis]|uniref:RNB domain-containing ribonuclease n=1 Tax=Leucobacter aridicollis TaxID=283878 RepID=UPI002104A1B1|nr:RNB domain-containing ribonuclease [Leucobacter aridicollis]UTX54064.1 RNB domain-containing ribonuclease [Leucobacter aridicollis]
MPSRRTHIAPHAPGGQLAAALTALREAGGIVDAFPPEALAEAVSATPPTPELDLRDIGFVTLDPAESRDLDQAFHIERRTGGGFVIRYAIADVPGFVAAGGALDAEARRRGQTLYLPDGSVPLHPRELSEGRASLLPNEERTAFVWTIELDTDGRAAFDGAAVSPARVERALIRSCAKLDYVSAQLTLDSGAAGSGPAAEALTLLREVGELRISCERARGGASLNMPEEEVLRDNSGYRIERRFPLRVEEWNAQLSLLTGMAAGRIMLDGGIGILRTMPSPDATALAEFHDRIAALGLPWPAGIEYGEYLRSVPAGTPAGAAVLHAAASLFRGADYAAFGVTHDGERLAPPERPEQAAIAAPYAHVTAPLRRLVDRWGLVICEALCAGREVPEWASSSLGEVPGLMRSSSSLAGRLGSEALDRIEAALLRDRAGEEFDAVVLEARGGGARVQIVDPAVTARVPNTGGALSAGRHARVRVVSAEIATGTIELAVA